MNRNSISRRSFLRGAAGATLALPFLSLSRARGADPTSPKRLIVFFTNNGTIKPAWTPTGTETNFQFGPILAPLEPHKQDLLVLSGIDVESSYHGPGSGDPHMPGMAHMLTGTEMIDTGPGQYDKAAGGISVDQFIAQQIDAPTPFRSLHFGVQSRLYAANPWNTMSYLGANQPVDPEDDPQAAFQRIFVNTDNGDADVRDRRLSVLDYVADDIASLQAELGAGDRAALQQHLGAVRDLERTVDSLGGAASCTPPADPGAVPGSVYDHANSPALFRAQTDLLVRALACDMTRVATLQWRGALGADATAVWLGHTETHHDISHRGDAAGEQMMIDINRWFAEQFAYLLASLRAIPEGDGTLLDHTAILWCNELSSGRAHNRRDMPYVLAGGAGGYFRTGRHVTYNGANHNDLLVSLCHAMDVPVATFGNPAYCTGPLSGLT